MRLLVAGGIERGVLAEVLVGHGPGEVRLDLRAPRLEFLELVEEGGVAFLGEVDRLFLESLGIGVGLRAFADAQVHAEILARNTLLLATT